MLDVSECSKLESFPEEIGDLEKLERLNAWDTLISRPPSSIVRLNKLKFLTFRKEESEDEVYFVFPQVNEGLSSLEELHLCNCNIIDGGLPEDIGSLSSLKKLDLSGNKFEHLPRSIAQLTALQTLYLSWCNRLQELPDFTGMPSLDILGLNCCNISDGGLPEHIGCLSFLTTLTLTGNNFEYLPRSIAQLGALKWLDISGCQNLTQLPEFPQQLHTIDASWRNDSICNSLFQNMSSLQHDISTSNSLSLRVLTSKGNIPSWFHHRGTGTSVIVNLPENWYVRDNFLGFAVCYSGRLFDITANLIPLCDDEMSLMTQNLALSNHSLRFPSAAIHFFLVPLAALWDTSKANQKTPNDYGIITLSFLRETKNYGFRLLYKDEAKVKALLQIRRSSDELRKNSVNNEASCSSYKKQRSHF
ncbi:hypothetical protein RDI58_007670 [Solanum bulbocastanum]|uniref:C-JID domain-containing protein n=1 Tax=Solanum bulbocastanum TaxID=147425 RepID=A0AAN8YJ44_SOLBU